MSSLVRPAGLTSFVCSLFAFSTCVANIDFSLTCLKKYSCEGDATNQERNSERYTCIVWVRTDQLIFVPARAHTTLIHPTSGFGLPFCREDEEMKKAAVGDLSVVVCHRLAQLAGVLTSSLDLEFGPQNAYVEILVTFATKMPYTEFLKTKKGSF